MSKLEFKSAGKRYYGIGVDHGVFYPSTDDGYGKGVEWPGLTNVTESPSGAEATPLYADNIKYLNVLSAEEFGATIEAYYSPEEFDECDGLAEIADGVSIGQQTRKLFGFSWRSKIGSDKKGTKHGYKIHLIYGCLAAPTERSNETISDSAEPGTLSWEVSTTPVEVTGFEPTSHVIIDSTKTSEEVMKKIEDKLYGTDSDEPALPTPDEIVELLKTA